MRGLFIAHYQLMFMKILLIFDKYVLKINIKQHILYYRIKGRTKHEKKGAS